ncbi:MAG: VCBS repeat-containing protein [Saprospiraceae bacterium]|nr:VCBS repeat-containing protein [Saprospiraceae bacterium]
MKKKIDHYQFVHLFPLQKRSPFRNFSFSIHTAVKIYLILICVPNYAIAQLSAINYISCGTCQSRTISAIDIDGDGDEDLVHDNYGVSRIDWVENKGSGVFGASRPLVSVKVNQLSYLVTDFDFDGDVDVFTDHDFSNEIYYHENTGNNIFAVAKLVRENFNVNGFSFMAAEDFNRDGKNELLVSSFGEKGFQKFHQDSSGNFQMELLYPSVSKGSHRYKLIDFDKDGDMDIVGGSTPIIFYENENGSFTKSRWLKYFTNNEYASSFDLGDIDGDGDVDLLCGKYGFHTQIWKNRGDMVFDTLIYLDKPKNVNFADVFFTDMDMDHDLDVVLDSKQGTGNAEEHVLWYENYGKGQFSKSMTIFNSAMLPDNIFLLDMDNDGDKDLFSKSYTKKNFFYRKNLAKSPFITGHIYKDDNVNGLLDFGEVILPDENLIQILPAPVARELDHPDGFKYYVDAGNYAIRVDTSICWSLTSSPAVYNLKIDTTPVQGLQFGLKLNKIKKQVTSHLTTGVPRCGFTVPFMINTRNTGCVSAEVKFSLVMDSLARITEWGKAPDVISGDTATWYLGGLDQSETRSLQGKMTIAGVDFIGDTITMPVLTYLMDDSGFWVLKDSMFYVAVINCSYDPNDKLSYPNRGGKNYTLGDEELVYTIRFQNTGTDTAFYVELRDTFDADLDINSIRPIGASHPFTSKLNIQDRELRVKFDQILLPDSKTDEVGSQGYFVFGGMAKKRATFPKVQLRNKAQIFFDFNPPIHTNTRLNTLVDRFSCVDSIGPLGEDILPMKLNYMLKPIVCHGDGNGKITMWPGGGIAPYRYQDILFYDSLMITDLSPGSYIIQVRDHGNCKLTSMPLQIADPDPLVMELKVQDTICPNTVAELDLSTIYGGVGPYTFKLDQKEIVEYNQKIATGPHHLLVLDRNGCIGDTSFFIHVSDSVFAYFTVLQPSKTGSEDGSIYIDSLTGGVAPYVIKWDDGSDAESITGLSDGSYGCTVKDENGCEFYFQFELAGPSATNTIPERNVFVGPNPVVSDVVIGFKDNSRGPLSVSLFNVNGQLLLKETDVHQSSEMVLPMEIFSGGHVFVLQIVTTQQIVTFRLVKP